MNKLEQAARALLAHWDTPAWKYLKPTGDLIADLREALSEQAEQEPAPWKHDCAALCMNDVELWIDNCPHCGKPRTVPSEHVKQEPVACPHGVDDGACKECYMEQTDYFDYGLEEVEDYLRNCCSNNFMADKLSDIRKSIYSAPVQQAEQEPMKECRHCGFLCKPNSNESRKLYPLEQSEQHPMDYDQGFVDGVEEGRRQIIEKAEQEPVAWMVTMENQDGTRKTFPLSGRYKDVRDMCDFGDPIPLYAAPFNCKGKCCE